jgi:hypothetical protein
LAALNKLRAIAEAQTFLAKVEADLSAFQESMRVWKEDEANKELALSARVDQASLDASVANLKAAMTRAGLQVPADLDTAPARESLAKLHDILDNTKTSSSHNVKDNVPAVKKEIDSLNGRNTSSTHYVHRYTIDHNAAGGWAGEAVQRLRDGGRAWRRFTGKVFGPERTRRTRSGPCCLGMSLWCGHGRPGSCPSSCPGSSNGSTPSLPRPTCNACSAVSPGRSQRRR